MPHASRTHHLLRAVLVLSCLAVPACARREGPASDPSASVAATDPSSVAATPTPPLAPLVWKTTAEIPGDASFHTLVDELARQPAIESSHVGAAGAPSKAYAAYQKVADVASPEQVVALLMHESPVVRGYLARQVARKRPDGAASLQPLFGDTTNVKTLAGCMGGEQTVAAVVMDATCDALRSGDAAQATRAAAAADLVEAVVRDRRLGPVRGQALACLTVHDAKRGAALARDLLGEPTLVKAALGALAASPSDEFAVVAPFADNPDPEVRAAAARALGAGRSPAALARVTALLDDANARVRQTAAAAYTRHPLADGSRVKALLDDPATSKATAFEIALRPRPETLQVLGAFLADHPDERDRSLPELARREPSDALTRFFRGLLASQANERGRDASNARAQAVFYLGRAHDRDSVPAIARSLEGFDVHELSLASNALAAIGGDEVIAELERTLGSAFALSRVYAAEALVKLRHTSSGPLIAAAATSGDAAQDARLMKLADQLAKGD